MQLYTNNQGIAIYGTALFKLDTRTHVLVQSLKKFVMQLASLYEYMIYGMNSILVMSHMHVKCTRVTCEQ